MGIDLTHVILRRQPKNLYGGYFSKQILRRSTPQNDICGASCRTNAVSAGIRTSGKAVRLQQNLLVHYDNRSYSIYSDCHARLAPRDDARLRVGVYENADF